MEETQLSPKLYFKTKAENLVELSPILTSARILPLYYFTVSEWKINSQSILTTFNTLVWSNQSLLVRSSAITEDTLEASQAGQYASCIYNPGTADLKTVIQQVINTYPLNQDSNQILIQPLLTDVKLSGVVFGYDPNTLAPYFIINYDDKSGKTDTVTSGTMSDLKSHVHHQTASSKNPILNKIINLVQELAGLYETYFLDIEFALDKNDVLYLFQVRPLVIPLHATVANEWHTNLIEQIADKIKLSNQPHPYLLGKKTVYGVMPDWNPAEIIGIRPKPLALSLYRDLITNAIWAYQRDNYGYRNLRSFPLLVDFCGLPYIDVRVSFNSFIPKTLSENIASRLVDYYIQKLISYPSLHDKVEFDIVFSCYTFDLQKRLHVLTEHGFKPQECDEIFSSLLKLTKNIIDNKTGLWQEDLKKVYKLEARRNQLYASQLDDTTTLYWLIEDCKRYGTLPFAGLARAGFIAIQILKSLVNVGILTSEQYHSFLSSTHTITAQMQADLHAIPIEDFLKKYGHLRPGTYDILSPRYDEEPDLYFDWSNMKTCSPRTEENIDNFQLSLSQLQKIRNHLQEEGLDVDVIDLMHFMKSAIETRELAKFIFTKNVSDFLKLIEKFCAKYSIPKEDVAYLNVSDILSLYSTSNDPQNTLLHSIQQGKNYYQRTKAINLPPLIANEEEVWSFELQNNVPNFITQKSHRGQVRCQINHAHDLKQAVVLIESADPGYDWIFSYDIGAFVTMYGGANSHMAIRAGEMGIPAVIGVGQSLYNQLSNARIVNIDCANKQIIDMSSNEKTYRF